MCDIDGCDRPGIILALRVTTVMWEKHMHQLCQEKSSLGSILANQIRSALTDRELKVE